MVLGDDLYRKMVLQHLDIGVVTYRCHQSALDLCAGIIGMVKDTELGVASFAVQVEVTVFFLVEVNAPVDQFLDTLWGVTYYLLHGGGVTEPVSRYHGVVDMFVEIIN